MSAPDGGAADDRTLEVSTLVDAAPADVWAIVSDLRRTGQWSPECRKVLVWRRGRARQGTWLTGFNRSGWALWATQSRVHRYVEGAEIGWTVLESGARWTYRVEPMADGTTLLVERRELPDGKPWVARLFTRAALGGEDQHDRQLRRGMRQTLARIKAAAETGRAA